MTERFAIYYDASGAGGLGSVGETWLGRSNTSGERLEQPDIPGFSPARIHEITASARHYGFHATLKPPFSLAENGSSEALRQQMAAFARRQARIENLKLKVGCLDGFMALVPVAQSTEMRALADTCVRTFDTFRKPPSAEELERRRKANLTDRQDALLQRWGYPYVMDAFRFHMTLTGRLPIDERDRLRPHLEKFFGPTIGEGVAVDGVSLFHQDARNAPFRRISHYPLGGETD